MKKLKVILIGAGKRGKSLTDIMLRSPEKFEVVAVAEPVESRRNYIKEKHHISEEMCFTDWKDLLALGKIADLAVIATMDLLHYEPTMEAISLRYDIILEKPVSTAPKECKDIAKSAEANQVNIFVCHVLRYAPFWIGLKEILDSGRIGDIMAINHEECVGNVHQSHSFVRGNWGNSNRSSCMLLQKSCHDMDLLQWLLGKKCKKVSSFGTLTHFCEKNAPKNSPEYCIEGCPVGEKCPYNAVKLYLDDKENEWFRTVCTQNPNPTDELVERALRETQYGKCAYKCDNDVVDHQTVNLLFEDDVVVNFSMNAFNKGGRYIHIMGTKGEIRAAADEQQPLSIYDFETKTTEYIDLSFKNEYEDSHGGGDTGIVYAAYDYLCGTYAGKSISPVTISCDNHMIVFAAEEARKQQCVIDLEEFIAGI